MVGVLRYSDANRLSVALACRAVLSDIQDFRYEPSWSVLSTRIAIPPASQTNSHAKSIRPADPPARHGTAAEAVVRASTSPSVKCSCPNTSSHRHQTKYLVSDGSEHQNKKMLTANQFRSMSFIVLSSASIHRSGRKTSASAP